MRCQMQKSDRIEDAAGLGCEVAVRRQRSPHLPARWQQTEQAERDVVFEGVAGEQGDDLVGSRQPEMRALVRREIRDVGAEQLDLSRTRPHVAVDLIEQRGLAGAIRTDDQAAFARPYRQRYALGYDKTAKRLRQVGHFESVLGCQRGHRDPLRSPVSSLLRPGTIPVGITRTMNRNTTPSSMFHRSI